MLNPSIIKTLKKVIGGDNLYTSPEELTVYSYDATQIESLPWAVARPATAHEISEILILANRERFPVIPRGAGTGMSGGSVPIQGGVVLSCERMNRILDIDEDNMTALVEPGVITGDLQDAVEARGLFYPPDPASSRFCTIGGNVAENAGGLRAVKYGVTKDYILGLEVVLPTGEIIQTGARTAKSVAGYDLTRLMVGSEGTLGVVTRITVKLLPLPESVRTLSVFFGSIDDAVKAVSMIFAQRIIPRALELVDRAALAAVEDYLNEDISGGAEAQLIVEVDGPALSAEREMANVQEIVRQANAVRLNAAESEDEREHIWKARRAISPALYTIKPKKINEDIVVPRTMIPALLREIEQIARRHGLLIVNFGHAGDGNIHTNVMIEEDEMEKARTAVKEIFETTLRMSGSITGEHGIGISKAPFLPLEYGTKALTAMKRIKDALDPNNVLNPGKIFLEG